MRTPARFGIVVLVAAPLALGACAATPSVDLNEARAWLETVQAAQSDGPGSAGSASMLVQADHDDEDEGIRLDFAAPTDLKRAEASCFGGGAVSVTVTVFSAGGTSSDSYPLDVPCDEEPHEIALGTEASSAALISAHGSPETYVHVELIQALTAER